MANSLQKITFAVLVFVLGGCAAVQKDFGHMSSAEYQMRPQLRQSLVNSSEPLNEAAIQKILSSKVAFPKTIHLAIVRLSESSDGLDFQMIDQEIAEKFYNKVNWGNRVRSIIPVPQVMIAKPATLTSLRQAAVLLQADALLIIKPVSYSDWKFQWFEDDKAKGITSLEVLLLDTKTSVVPYTSIITETVEIRKDKADYGNDELMNRAKKASEVKALLQVAPAVQKFMSKTM
jgi:hypothetical protein